MPISQRPDLAADPVRDPALALGSVEIAEIDPEVADTEQFCATYDTPLGHSANCVIVAGRRGGVTRYAAVMVLATDRADVNGVIRKRIDARKCSFAAMDDAVQLTGMEYGGITPIGIPGAWPILVDANVLRAGTVIIGSGRRASKLLVPAAKLLDLPNAEELALTV